VTTTRRSRAGRIRFPEFSELAFTSLWVLIFCIPWEDEVSVGQGVAISHLAGVLASLIGVMSAVVYWRIRRIHAVHYLLGALVAWMAATYFWSLAPDETVTKAGSCLQLLFMVWLIWEFAPTQDRQVSLIRAYVFGSYVSASSVIYSFVTHTGSNLGLSEGRYTAAGFDENELGTTLALALVMSCYLLTKPGLGRLVWFFHIPTCILAICLTGSRGAFVSASIAALIFPLSFHSLGPRTKWVVCVGLLVLTGTAVAVLPESTWQRLGTIQSEVANGTLTKRTYIWAAGLDVFRDHPLLGVGAGAFGPSVYSRLDIAYVAHNSYLSVLVELGVTGAVLFSSTLVMLCQLILRLPMLERRTWLILMVTWSVAVSSLSWEHRKPTWFLFGLLIAQSQTFAQARSRSPSGLASRSAVGDASYEGAVRAY